MYCQHCGEFSDLPFECNYCGGQFCSNHRLLEAHECDGVEFLSNSDRWFKSKSTGNVVTSKSEILAPEPVEPEYTVGSKSEPEFESSPDVELTPEAQARKFQEKANKPDITLLIDRIKKWLGFD